MATKRDTAAAKPLQPAGVQPTQTAGAQPPRPAAKPQQAAAAPKRAGVMSHRHERLERVRAATAIPTVRVTPASDDLRRELKHPSGIGFRSTGSVEWPHDKFTKRRLADGSVKQAETKETRPR